MFHYTATLFTSPWDSIYNMVSTSFGRFGVIYKYHKDAKYEVLCTVSNKKK
jgi:hypothetical protein